VSQGLVLEHELATRNLDHREFERCAQDLLTEIYPGLVPIPGGTDWGRDADIPDASEPPVRLLVTTSRTATQIRQNGSSCLFARWDRVMQIYGASWSSRKGAQQGSMEGASPIYQRALPMAPEGS
jgi:hypothetical protein